MTSYEQHRLRYCEDDTQEKIGCCYQISTGGALHLIGFWVWGIEWC